MPKSSSAVRPSGSTNRLPPCRSPWKMPWIIAPSMNADHPGAHDAPRCRCRRRCMPATSSKLKPVEPLHHQHPAGDERRVRAGHDVAVAGRGRRASRRRRACSRPRGGSRAPRRSSRRTARPAPAGWPARRPGCARRGAAPATPSTRRSLCTSRPTPGRCTLTTTVLAGAQRGGVHLGDRRGGERRRGRTTANTSSSGRPRSASTTCAHDVERLGRHLVAAHLELARRARRGNRPSPERDDLAELDVGRAERLGGEAQAAREVGAAGRPSARPRLRRHSHGTTARPSGRRRRPRGARAGSRRGLVRRGTCWAASRRSCSASAHHAMRVAIEHPRRVVGERAPLEIGWSTHRSPAWRPARPGSAEIARVGGTLFDGAADEPTGGRGRCSTPRRTVYASDEPPAHVFGRVVAYKWVVAIVFVSALFLDILDTTIVNVALPTLGEEFQHRAPIEWVVLGYTLSASPCGSRRRAGWATGSAPSGSSCSPSRCSSAARLLCALAQTIGQLIAFRVLQGVGGGMLTPVGMAMLFRAFPPTERARASTIVMIPTLFAPALGPVLGGPGHRTSAGAGSSTSTCRSASSRSCSAALPARAHASRPPGRFDVAGFVLSGGGLALDRLRPQRGPERGWTSTRGRRLGDRRRRWRSRAGVRRDPHAAPDARRCGCSATGCSATPTSSWLFPMASFLGLMFVMPLYLQSCAASTAARAA